MTEFNYCSADVESICKKLDTDLETGLTEIEAADRLVKYGTNELPKEEPVSLLTLFIEQFEDTLVRILLFAAIVSAIVGASESHSSYIDQFIEPIVIITVLVVNAIISIKQTLNAEEAISALKEYEPEIAKVYRESTIKLIKAKDLVVGDVVELRIGDRVPADIRICAIYTSTLCSDQSILTGESHNIYKTTETIKLEHMINQDKLNILFSGTNIVSGKARGIVVATGISTEIGKIREHLLSTPNQKTPLQIKLDEFGNQLSFLITIICVLVWVINIHHFDDEFHGNSWLKGAIYYFKIAISLAVAAIPEGLPAVITTCLAIGTKRMAKKNAIVRTLRSVETLGCVSVICSDKTGTITTNQMSCQKVFILTDDVISFDITGTTYDYRDGTFDQNIKAHAQLFELISECCALCNDAQLFYKDSVYRVGEATEAALLCLIEKINIYNIKREFDVSAVYNKIYHEYNKLFTLEFSRDRKSMSVLCQKKNKNLILYVKGAFEEIIQRSSFYYDKTIKKLSDTQKQLILNQIQISCSNKDSLRLIGLAMVENPPNLEKIKELTDYNLVEKNMIFLGVIGMIDPPRTEVLSALNKCADAGIRVIVITGDNKDTAESICHKVGIFDTVDNIDEISYSSKEFDSFTHTQKLEACKKARLFSRVEPKHKSEIIGCLQELGEVTAMTGDGVNDAPALKKAEIGVAMGSGTAVAKSSSDIVLADDNFSTIVSAVFEGRAIFHNAVQFISYLVSSNIGEVVCILITSLMGLPECLIPVQLLWVNLITDGLPATALGFNPPPDNIMRFPPRNPKRPMIGAWQIFRYCIIGLYVGMATIGGSLYWYMYDPTGPGLTFRHLVNHQHCSGSEPLYQDVDCQIFNHFVPMTISLSILVFSEMLNACNSMSDSASILQFPPTKNVFLVLAIFSSIAIHMATLYFTFTQKLFDVAMLSFHQWQVVLMFSFPVILLDECLKYIYRTNLNKTKLKLA